MSKVLIKILGLSVLTLVATGTFVRAETFTLTNNQSGARFFCDNGSTNPNPPVTDPACVPSVSDYCNKSTSYTSSQCFDKATESCRGAGAKFSDCVAQTSAYCDRNTSLTGTQCFDRSLDSCKGSSLAIQSLMEAVKVERALK